MKDLSPFYFSFAHRKQKRGDMADAVTDSRSLTLSAPFLNNDEDNTNNYG